MLGILVAVAGAASLLVIVFGVQHIVILAFFFFLGRKKRKVHEKSDNVRSDKPAGSKDKFQLCPFSTPK